MSFGIGGLFVGIVSLVAGIIVMVFYILEKPHKLTSFWKVAPIVMVFYYALEWYYDCIVYRGIDDTNVLIGVTIVLVILLLYPLFFVSFKYGYSSDFMKTGGQSQSCSARDLLSDKPN